MNSPSEFALIRDYLSGLGADREDVIVDVGDDCALLRIPEGFDLAVSVDTLVSGVHFFADCDAEALGHKALAVSLSDLAAVGAQPSWATLALTLPQADAAWLQRFARGFAALGRAHGLRLVGGDLTRGPLSITVQVQGLVEVGRMLRRGGARPGELIMVSGYLGDAGLALRWLQGGEAPTGDLPAHLRCRLERPTPRVELGRALCGLASAAIDLSDGLSADLGHLLESSGCGGELQLGQLPLSPEVRAAVHRGDAWELPLCSGDDYELCFTLPAQRRPAAEALARDLDCPVSVIGKTTEDPVVRYLTDDGRQWSPRHPGFDHFHSEQPHD